MRVRIDMSRDIEKRDTIPIPGYLLGPLDRICTLHMHDAPPFVHFLRDQTLTGVFGFAWMTIAIFVVEISATF